MLLIVCFRSFPRVDLVLYPCVVRANFPPFSPFAPPVCYVWLLPLPLPARFCGLFLFLLPCGGTSGEKMSLCSPPFLLLCLVLKGVGLRVFVLPGCIPLVIL